MTTNGIKTFILLGLLTAFFVFIGGALGGQNGMVIALIIAVGMNFFSYWYSDKIILKMYKAEEVDETNQPKLYSVVRKLAEKAQLPMPKVYIIQSGAPNAFATGRNPQNAAVAVTNTLLTMLNEDELEGVLAHELAHVYGRDILISTIAASLAGAIMLITNIAQWGMMFGGGNRDEENSSPMSSIVAIAMIFLAPIAAMIVQMTISRSREYIADERGGKITGNPKALASALQKISYGISQNQMSEAKPAMSHMFIMNPFFGSKGMMSLFSTHPPVEERIRRLNEQANERRSQVFE